MAISTKLNFRPTVLIVSLLAALIMSLSAAGQNYPPRDAYQPSSNADYVTVYEDCDFQGKGRALAAGSYGDVRDLNLRNDSISSVQVPPGMRVVLYENERLRGKSTLISNDIRCLNRDWNDQTSSIKVVKENSNRRAARDAEGYTDSRPDDRRGYEGRRNNRNDSAEDNRRRNDVRNFTKGVTSIAFANTTLAQSNGNRWRMVSGNKEDVYRETARTGQVIYLQHNRFNQQLQIDMFANKVLFQTSNGRAIEYPITGVNTARANRPNPRQEGQNRVIASSCFRYQAYTKGGRGGIRFHGKDGFHQFTNKGFSDRICHAGPLVMEINKTEPGTEVVVEINNEQYRFAANEKADAFRNTWYRKKVTLIVGKN